MATYEIEQYIYNENDNDFLNRLNISVGTWKSALAENNIITETNFIFNDTCFFYENSFKKNKSYYFHGFIKKMAEEQTIFIKLGNTIPGGQATDYQYIKKITVPARDASDDGWWEDGLSFSFSPVEDFNCIIFQLQRTEIDFKITPPRKSIILCSEISLVNNIEDIIKDERHVIKLGVRARAGSKICINNEEIIIGPTRVFEIDKDIIEITFLSALAPLGVSSQLRSLFNTHTESDVINPDESRLFNDFIIDYMYYI